MENWICIPLDTTNVIMNVLFPKIQNNIYKPLDNIIHS